MKYLVIYSFFLLAACAVSKPPGLGYPVKAVRIWNGAHHNAFTDLVRFDGAFYCVCREAPSHVSGPASDIRVLRSDDGRDWQSAASFKLAGKDLRDPKLSVTPDSRLMVLMDAESYQDGKITTRKPYASFLDGPGGSFSDPEELIIDPAVAGRSDWVWRITWYGGAGYAIDYQPDGIFLLKTTDAKHLEKVSKIAVNGYPNESTIRFDRNGKMYVLIRREGGDKMGIMATSNAPYMHWKFRKLGQRLGGPNFIFLDKSTLLIGSRLYPKSDGNTSGGEGPQTAVFIAGLTGKIRKIIPLPSGGDTGYPGMLIYRDKLWVTYYSSHEENTAIYLAKIPLSELK